MATAMPSPARWTCTWSGRIKVGWPSRITTSSTLLSLGQAEVAPLPASSSCTGFDACREQGTRCTWPETLASVTQLICSGADFAAQDYSRMIFEGPQSYSKQVVLNH